MPHLSALAILLAGSGQEARPAAPGTGHLTPPSATAELIDQLRERRLTLTYDHENRTLRTDTDELAAVTIGR